MLFQVVSIPLSERWTCAMRNSSMSPLKGSAMPLTCRRMLGHLRHEQKHHHGGQTIAPYSGSIAGAPEATQLPALATERSPQPVDHNQ